MGAFVTKYSPEDDVKEISLTKRLEVTAVQPPSNVTIRNGYITDWGNNRNDIIWDLSFKSTGSVNIDLGISNNLHHGHAEIQVMINEDKLVLRLAPKDRFAVCTTVHVGSTTIKNPGYVSIRLKAKEETKGAVGRLYFLQLTGPAVRDLEIHTHDIEKYIKASDVRLLWNTSCFKVNMFYNEITVHSQCTDALFVACGFYRGYLGFDHENIVFCIDNPGLAPEIPKEKIPNRYKIRVIDQAHGSRVHFIDGHLKAICSYYHRWNVGETYNFLITAKACTSEDYVLYAAYFHKTDMKKWVLIGAFKAIDLHVYFTELYSSIENCQSFHGYSQYSSNFGPAFTHTIGKGWNQITNAQFMQGGMTADVNAYVTDDNNFSLTTGESTVQSIPSEGRLHCHRKKTLPECLMNFHIEHFSHSSH